MKIAVLGTGMVGQAIAGKLVSLGHDVIVGTRDASGPSAEKLAPWLSAHPSARLARFAEAAAHGEIVFNCTNGHATLAALTAAGAENLAGKPLVDLANPLDFSNGFPPRLWVCNDDSLAEQVQRAFPAAKVVKTLNTVNADLMVEPARLGATHAVFLSGDDAGAKAEVRALLESFGWAQIVDLGALETARATEMMLPIWLRVWRAKGSANFGFAVVGP